MLRAESQAYRARKRARVRLTSKLDKSLTAYTLAATAAGVGLLSMAEPAQARIVATSTNIVIPENGGVIQFDINQDGVPDFGLSARIYEFAEIAPPMGNFSSSVRVIPAQTGNKVWAVSSHKGDCAAAVRGGLNIDDVRPFKGGALIMVEAAGSYTRGRSSHCPWHGSHPPFLGLKFLIDGKIHYGWARVMVAVRSAVLTGFAYETVADQPIAAGATRGPEATLAGDASDIFLTPLQNVNGLGSLAMGSSGLAAWKREDEQIAYEA